MKAIRLQRFKGFRDTGWIEIKPITLLFGHNSSGKSTILNALLMLKQSLENPAKEVPFVFSSDSGVDLGTYEDIVNNHKIDFKQPIVISIRTDLDFWYDPTTSVNNKKKRNPFGQLYSPGTDCIKLSIDISYNQNRKNNEIIKYTIKNTDAKTIFSMYKKSTAYNAKSYFFSDYYNLEEYLIKNSFSNFINIITIDKNKTQNFIPLISEKITSLHFLNMCLEKELRDFFEKISNIGPVRAVPKRTQFFTGENPATVGIRGEDALQLLYLSKYGKHPDYLESRINNWLSAYHYKFEWKLLGSNLGQFILTDTRTGTQVPLKDVGFGLSQILPVVIQVYAAPHESVVLIEQPEIHLHSKAQAELGDLFLDAVYSSPDNDTATPKYLIVETHSENLLLRIRRRLAENYLKKNPGRFPKAEDIAIYFIENVDGESIAHRIILNDKGEFETMPDSFRKFFSDDFEEIMRINESLAQIKISER